MTNRAHDAARLREIAWVFTRLGFTAFGGPAAHVAMIEDEVVTRRGWIDRAHFLDLVSAVNFIPGPNSTELAIHLGYLRGGRRGLVVAGVCFITPAVLIILPLGWMYVTYGQLPRVNGALQAITASVLGIILIAGYRLARTSLTSPLSWIIAITSLVLAVLGHRYGIAQYELILLGSSALAGALWARSREDQSTTPAEIKSPPPSAGATALLPLLALPLPFAGKAFTLFLLMLKIGATLFGSGYVLASYLQADLVTRTGFLSNEQLSHAISVGQITPGPLLTTATFVGYTLGHAWYGSHAAAAGLAVLATVGIFLPSFVFVALLAPFWSGIRGNPTARGALSGMNAVVVTLIAIVAWRLIYENIRTPILIGILGVTLALLLTVRINATWLVLSAGLIGWLCM